MPVRLLEAWKSLEWWNIVPLGWKLRAHDIDDFQSRLELLPASSPRLPRPSHDLGYRLVAARGNISLSDFVSTAIYLLSNRLHDDQDSDKGLQILFSLFEHDVHLFTQILECEPSTGRAIWESLMSYSENRHRMRRHPWGYMSNDSSNEHFEKEYDKRVSRFLLDIGIRYSWVDASDFGVLRSALEMNCPSNVLENILDHFCRSGHGHDNSRSVCETISTSIRKGHLNIANRLIRRFHINDEFLDHSWTPDSNGGFPPTSVFLAFVRWVFHGNDDNHWHVLEFFLSNGADVDSNLHGQTYYVSASRLRWYDKNEINRALRPTILDHSLRLDRRLFMRLAQHSKVPKSALTKSGLLISLEKGPAALRDYLKTRVPAIDPFNLRVVGSLLRFIVDDQLDPDEWGLSYDINLKIVRNLLQYADNMHWHSIFHRRINELFDEVVVTFFRRPEQFESATDDDWQLLDALVQEGADIRDGHLEFGAEKEGTRFLKWVRPLVKDFATKAAGSLTEAVELNNFEAVQFLVQSGVDPIASVDLAEAVRKDNFEMVEFLVQSGVNPDAPAALGIAARRNNFEVVEFLLQRGANPNAFVSAKTANLTVLDRAFNKMTQASLDQTYSLQAVASGIGEVSDERSSLDMFRFLAERGAKFVLGPNDLTPFAFIAFLLENIYDDPELFAKVEFVVSTLKQTTHWARPPAFLLEICVGKFKRTANSWQFKERIRIFEYLLDEGAGVNPGSPLAALTFFGAPRELVERVLDSGANLDSHTAVKLAMRPIQTPLQAAASEGNEDMVNLFLDRGANVNLPARGEWGRTALQAICGWDPATEQEHCRKMTICERLLKSGADINAPPGSCSGITALQAAVLKGDLELVAVLLHAGADVNGPPYKSDNSASGYRGCYFKFSVLDLAAKFGRLDIAKLLLNANAVSGVGGITGYDGAINIAKRYGNKAVASLICEHLGNVMQPGLVLLDFWTAANDYDAHGHDTDCESADEKCILLRNRHRNADNDRSSIGEESSECDSESASTSEWDSLTGHESGDAPRYDFTEGGADIQWDNYLVPDSFTGALTEISDAQAFADLQVVANTSTNDWISHSGAGFVFPEEDMQLPGTDWMLQNPFDAWAGMADDNALWQQGFEIQDLDSGFASFDPSRQLPFSDQLEEPDIEGQDVVERDFTQ